MTAPVKRRLSCRLEDFEAVRSGRKVATVRFSQQAARIRRGDALVMAFGARHAPRLVEAVVVRTERICLEPELRRGFDLPPDVMSLKAEYEFYARPLEPDDRTPEALLEALRDSGPGDYAAVLSEAAERGVSACTCVWWTLTT